MKVQYEILFALMSGERLSVRKAFRLFHTTELRKVVSRLRRRGHDIRSEKRTGLTYDGRTVTYNEYYMAHEN